MKRMELEDRSRLRAHPDVGFDVSKLIKLNPPFQELDIDKYFIHFNKIAKWSNEHWTCLFKNVF